MGRPFLFAAITFNIIPYFALLFKVHGAAKFAVAKAWPVYAYKPEFFTEGIILYKCSVVHPAPGEPCIKTNVGKLSGPLTA
jgi:hypothetical protein